MSATEMTTFTELNTGAWQTVLSDPCVNAEERTAQNQKLYEQNWFKDGEVGNVENKPEGMQLTAGPELFNNAHHLVLWTKQSFKGDLKIEFDFTVTDFENRCVNILYIQATGAESLGFNTDISTWARPIPAMKEYFGKMNTYHVSLAAYGNMNKIGPASDYIRLRRYNPEQKDGKLDNTDIKPDYFDTGLFTPGVEHNVTVIKKDQTIAMRILAEGKESYFAWTNTIAEPITEGRIGLRLMSTRSSRFKNFTIAVPK